MRRSVLRVFFTLSLLLCLSGCGLIDAFFLPPPEDTAQELYEAGNDAMREKDYMNAASYFVKLKDKYPFSPYTIEAELALADAYYLDDEYILAMDSYKEFETLHPRHKAMPYVLYQVGQSGLNSFVSIDRPQTTVNEAFEYFRRLKETYPGSEYAEKATEGIKACRKIMAERELYVGDFYWRSGKYGAAYRRYQYVVDKFSDVEEYFEYATEHARIAFLRYQQEQAQQDREAKEGSWKEWLEWL